MADASERIGERTVDGLRALTLASCGAGGIEASFVPEAGMVGCSLRHRGEEVLGQRSGLARYVASGATMGIPFLHPWANRLGASRFVLAGREVRLDGAGARPKLDPNGLPIHGLLAAARGWLVERHATGADGAVLVSRFDFGAHQDLLAAFPFPHQIELEARLADATLTITTRVRATGDAGVPIAFGFHPYFSLPGLSRREWEVAIPVSERLVLDDRMLPTGERETVSVESGRLGSRAFDYGYVAPRDGAPFALVGGGRRIEVAFGPGYPYAQVYAPRDAELIAFEPMTVPTDALVADQDRVVLLSRGDEYAAAFTITISATGGASSID